MSVDNGDKPRITGMTERREQSLESTEKATRPLRRSEVIRRALENPVTVAATQKAAKALVDADQSGKAKVGLNWLADERAKVRWDNRAEGRNEKGCFHRIGYKFLVEKVAIKTVADVAVPALTLGVIPYGPGDVLTAFEGATGRELPILDVGPIKPEKFDWTTRGVKVAAALIPYLPASMGEPLLMAIVGPVVDLFKTPGLEEQFQKNDLAQRTEAYKLGAAGAFTEPKIARLERFTKIAKNLEAIKNVSTRGLKEKLNRLGMELWVRSHYPVKKMFVPEEANVSEKKPDGTPQELTGPFIPDKKVEAVHTLFNFVRIAGIAALVGGSFFAGFNAKEALDQVSLQNFDVALQTGGEFGAALNRLAVTGVLAIVGLKLLSRWENVRQISSRFGPGIGQRLHRIGGGTETFKKIKSRSIPGG